MKNYRIFLKMFINDYVSDRTFTTVNGRYIYKENISINPSPSKVIQTLIDRIGGANTERFTPEKWKREWIYDVNAAEEKHYDPNMTLEEFIKVLEKEGVIRIEEIETEKEGILIVADEKPKLKGQLKL